MVPNPIRPPPGPSPRVALSRSIALLLFFLWALATWGAFAIFRIDQRTAGSWGCEMSYMTASYYKLDWKENPAPRYSAYLYREAGFDPSEVSGHPVIFIPGNAGSFMQVRSIASSASRQYFSNLGNGLWSKPLDVFAADFNEDLSAVHAPTLEEQGTFLASLIPRVLAEYQHLPAHRRPTQVTLLGHSMGGIVARLAVAVSNSTSVDAIITMSTPHSQPPVAMASAMQSLYSRINAGAIPHQDGPLLISICGGQSDTQIVSDACALSTSIIGEEDGFGVFTTSIPGVWTGVEHQAMVWCHQVRWRVARALLDMAGQDTRQSKLKEAKVWLLDTPHLVEGPSSTQELETHKIDIATYNKSVLVHVPGSSESSIAKPPMVVQYCLSTGDCIQQSPEVQTIPWLSDSIKPFPNPGEGSRPEESAFVVDIDSSQGQAAWTELSVPSGAKITTGHRLQETQQGAGWASHPTAPPTVHLILPFKRLLTSVTVWRLSVTLSDCSGPRPVVQFKPHSVDTLRGVTTESRFFPVRPDEGILLHSHISGSPFQSGSQSAESFSIHVYQQPMCQVSATRLALDIPASLAKAILRWRVAAITWMFGWTAVILGLQLEELARTGNIPSFGKVLRNGVSPALKVVAVLLAIQFCQSLAAVLGYTTGDLALGYTDIHHAPFTVVMAFWTLGATAMVRVVVDGVVALLAKLAGKSFTSTTRGRPELTKAALPRLTLGLILLLSVAVIIPSGMALAILLLVFFALTSSSRGNDDQSRLHFLSTLLSLMVLVLPFNLPEIAVWGKNLWSHGGRVFPEDHSILAVLPSLVLVLLCSYDQVKWPGAAKFRTWALRCTQVSAFILGVVAFLFSPRRQYLLLHAVNVLFLASSGLLLSYV